MGIHFHIAAPEAWFLVPSVVADHLDQATERELKVLLLLLQGGREVTDRLICERLAITEAELQGAVAAWISRGVLQLEERWITLAQPPLTLARPERKPAQELRRPDYEMTEVQRALEHDEPLRQALQAAPVLLNRPVGQTEFGLLYALHDYYGFSPESILLLLRHCRDMGRTSGRAIESLAASWHGRDIVAPEEVEKAIADERRRRGDEAMVRRAFGLGDRRLTPAERAHIERWVSVWRFEEPLLEQAYNRGVDHAGKVSFSYINRILSDWQVKGIRSVEQAEQEDLPLRRPSRKKAVDTKQEPSYNIKEFEEWSFQALYGGIEPSDTSEQEGGDGT